MFNGPPGNEEMGLGIGESRERGMKNTIRCTECETPTPKLWEVLLYLVEQERSSNKCYRLCTCRGHGIVIVDRAV